MQKGKIAVILLSVLIMVSLVFAGGIFYLLQQERKHSLSLQEELDDTKANLSIKESELGKYRSAAVSLESKLKDANNSIGQISADLQQERYVKQQALYEIEQLKADLAQQKNIRADLEKKFNQAQSEMQKVQSQLKDLSDKKAELETKLKELDVKAKGVELGTIVVSGEGAGGATTTKGPAREQPGKAATALEGKVLVINKDYNFVVINLGGKDAVKIGDTFSVYHGNKYLGDVKVEKVHDAMSAAGFVSADLKGKVSEGDKVIQKTQ
jgi:uncharacterized membrane-anchored protein YhcB (DUF1043 family)